MTDKLATPTPTPEDGEKPDKLGEQYKKLRDLLDSIPKSHLASMQAVSSGITEIAQFEAFGLHRQIDRIEAMATIGDEDAIESLRLIGSRITLFLQELAGLPQDSVQKLIDSDPLKYREFSLTEENAFNKKGTLEEIFSLMNVMSKNFPTRLKVFRDKLREAPGHYICLKPDLIAKEASIHRDPTALDESTLLVIEIFERIVGRRAIHESRRVIRRLLKKSNAWPIMAFALEDNRGKTLENYTSTLRIGHDIGFKISPTPGRGGSRKFERGSRLWFASELAAEIAAYRTTKENMFADHLAEYKNAEKLYATTGLDDQSGWTKANHWKRKAVLLPESSQLHLEAWLDAAMSLVESKCDGDWELLKWIPTINARRAHND